LTRRRGGRCPATVGFPNHGRTDNPRGPGRRLACTDRNLFGQALLDTATGAEVELPDAAVVGFVGANVLLRGPSELLLVTPSGQVLDRVTEPADLATARLIGHKP
jgi:hypothetical protein